MPRAAAAAVGVARVGGCLLAGGSGGAGAVFWTFDLTVRIECVASVCVDRSGGTEMANGRRCMTVTGSGDWMGRWECDAAVRSHDRVSSTDIMGSHVAGWCILYCSPRTTTDGLFDDLLTCCMAIIW